MKKLVLFFAAAFCCVGAANAQTFSNGSQIAEATLGFGPTSIAVSYEQGVLDIAEDFVLGVGGTVDVIPNTAFGLTAQAAGNVHWTAVQDFDFYAGLMLGYGTTIYKNYSVGGLATDFALGARYYFNEQWAVTANINHGFAVGVTMKL